MKQLCQQWKVKLIFSEALETVWWLDLIDPDPRYFTTDVRHWRRHWRAEVSESTLMIPDMRQGCWLRHCWHSRAADWHWRDGYLFIAAAAAVVTSLGDDDDDDDDEGWKRRYSEDCASTHSRLLTAECKGSSGDDTSPSSCKRYALNTHQQQIDWLLDHY